MKRILRVLVLGFLMLSMLGCSEVEALKVQLLETQQQVEASQNKQAATQQQKQTEVKVINTVPVQVKRTPAQLQEEVQLSSCEIKLDSDSANTYNAMIVAKALNGKTIKPGKVFSFNNEVGERTEAKGYIEGRDAKNNKVFAGGICRFTSAAYGAALDAGLEIIERHPHNPAVHYVPPGRDATVDYNSGTDFKFRNTSGYPLTIYTSMKKEKEKNIAYLEVRFVNLVEEVK